MVFVCIAAGVERRPNNSFAAIFGLSGWASTGSGLGSSVPLSCAIADEIIQPHANNASEQIRRAEVRLFIKSNRADADYRTPNTAMRPIATTGTGLLRLVPGFANSGVRARAANRMKFRNDLDPAHDVAIELRELFGRHPV